MIGDIALISAPEKKAALNVAGQRAVTRDFTTHPYTHVALLLGSYRVLHAMPAPDHVELTVIQELFSPQDKWDVWRHQDFAENLEADTQLHYRFLWESELYVGERYNNPVRLRSKEHHSFCSELIGKVYSQFERPFPESAQHLMPITIAKTVQNDSRWFDVTDEYRRLLADDPRYRRLHDTQDLEDGRRLLTALNDAKDAAKDYAALAEPFERLQRFARWNVEPHRGGPDVWSLQVPLGSRVLSREAVEWLSLLLRDEIDFNLVDLYVSLKR